MPRPYFSQHGRWPRFRFLPCLGGELMMRRRNFLAAAAAAPAALTAQSATGQPPIEPAGRGELAARRGGLAMHVGCQRGPTTPQLLDFFKRHGVNHICGYPPDPGPEGHWSVDDLKRTKDLCQQHGVSLDMVALPFLSSSHI